MNSPFEHLNETRMSRERAECWRAWEAEDDRKDWG